jgi:hypothetical protein
VLTTSVHSPAAAAHRRPSVRDDQLCAVDRGADAFMRTDPILLKRPDGGDADRKECGGRDDDYRYAQAGSPFTL